MDFENVWKKIICNVNKAPGEIQTIPILRNKSGVWFYVESENSEIYISKANKNKPSSNIKARAHIQKQAFERTYPIYLRRCNGEKVSREAQKASHFQVYIYSIFQNYGEI